MPVLGLTCWERPYDTVYARGERTHMLSSTYTDAFVAVGGTPVLVPSVPSEHVDSVLAVLDGLVITGGGDVDPAHYGAENTHSSELDHTRDAWEFALLAGARRQEIPVLGICRGCQVLNVSLGGTLHQHVWGTTDHPHLLSDDETALATGYHDVRLTGSLAEIYGTQVRRVTSLHHQAIDRVGHGLEVVATSPDGHIEGVVATGSWVALGVQWHPERLADEHDLFRWFTEQAVARSQARMGAGENSSSPSVAVTSIVSPSE